jgi:lipopolysaccharide export LptBFGC system permease protein LptF
VIARLDRYILAQLMGTFAAVVGIVFSMMVLEHTPSLLELARLAGHAGTIIAQSIIGLVPEYLGLGLVFGLFMAIALTVRRMTMRGELEAIEAAGISPRRWLRMPGVLVLAVAATTLLNQGWLLPHGEARLGTIARRIALGDFGYNIVAGEFVDLGDGATLRFDRVDEQHGMLEGVFLGTRELSYSARSARIAIDPVRGILVELLDGQAVDRESRHTMTFTAFRFDSQDRGGRRTGAPAAVDPLRQMTLPQILGTPGVPAQANAVGRALWVLLTAMVSVFALVLGKPPKRGSGSLGIFAGLVLTVIMIKMIGFVADAGAHHPLLGGAMVAALGVATCAVLFMMERRLGAGFFDRWAASALSGLRRAGRRKPSRAKNDRKSRGKGLLRDELRAGGQPQWVAVGEGIVLAAE